MAYWLSNASTLLFLIQRSLKSGKAEAAPPNKHPPTSLFGRMTQVWLSLSYLTSINMFTKMWACFLLLLLQLFRWLTFLFFHTYDSIG